MTIQKKFILIEKPPQVTGGEFFDILVHLRTVLDALPDDWDITLRLHWRLSIASDKVIICASFNTDDIDIEDLQRLPAYIQSVVPRFTVEQVRDAMRNRVTVFGGIHGTYGESLQGVTAYLVQNIGEWNVEIG